MKDTMRALTRSPIGLVGVALASASAILIITLVIMKYFGLQGGPYLGILAFVVLPCIFVFGLLLIPVGLRILAVQRARRKARGESFRADFPIIDLNVVRIRRVVLVVLLLTMVNLVILSVATFEAVDVMESNEFCGTTCHTVMEPEWTAYQDSAHSQVACVECHIGEGADWFVKSKLSGSYQLYAVAFNKYPTPIASPVHSLRPARDTCEHCHWPTKFVGNKLAIKTIYGNDEESSEMITALLLKVGGLRGDSSTGIHWHVDPGVEIRYRSDLSREMIYDVELTRNDGSTTTYRVDERDEEGEEEPEIEWRVMDCVDCHNRPSHNFYLPEQAVDRALFAGDLSRELPFARKRALKALKGDFANEDEARSSIEASLDELYRSEGSETLSAQQNAALRDAVDTLTAIWARNVFPDMNLDWGTYPSHIGHEQSPGCTRCHDDEHATAEGDVISGDCDVCHTIIAMEEDAAEVMEMLGFDG